MTILQARDWCSLNGICFSSVSERLFLPAPPTTEARAGARGGPWGSHSSRTVHFSLKFAVQTPSLCVCLFDRLLGQSLATFCFLSAKSCSGVEPVCDLPEAAPHPHFHLNCVSFPSIHQLPASYLWTAPGQQKTSVLNTKVYCREGEAVLALNH